jgi:lysozyme family protein
MADFNSIAAKTFNFEGGYQALSKDTANYCNGQLIGTNHGISAIAYKAYYGYCPTVDQMKSLTTDQAKAIYKKNYWDILQGDKIANNSVAHIFFDAFIASGYNGLKRIKGYVNTYYGKTVIAVNNNALTAADAAQINNAQSQKLFDIAKAGEVTNRNYLATSNPTQYAAFLNGWLNRLNQITYDGTNFIKNNPIVVIIFSIIAMGIVYVALNPKILT